WIIGILRLPMPVMHISHTHTFSGLFDCFEDVSTCCYGFWCCPFLTCTVSRRFGEQTFLMCGVPVMIPPVTLSLRASIRNKRGLEGSLCDDILISCCCIWCSWCQMHLNMAFILINHTTTLFVLNLAAPPCLS
uniref:Plac8 onzin related protein 2 n=1 Tax=Xiphophorus couchianus TaxID=32473 RepID=A0A3B5LGQ5_9TELE